MIRLDPALLVSLFTGMLALLSGCTSQLSTPSFRHQRCNIVLVTTDQQTLTAMSACRNAYLSTPAMDRLAAGGVRFEQSYCASPVCGPSRSGLLTGRMPHETGVNHNLQSPNPEIPNLGQLFSRTGYETVWAGKWHLPVLYPAAGSERIPGFEILPLPAPIHAPFHGDDVDSLVTDAATEFLRRRHDRPFLLAVSLLNPHDICYYLNRSRKFAQPPSLDVAPPLPANFAVDPQEPEFLRTRRRQISYGGEMQFTRNWAESDWRRYLYVYYRMVERVDAQLDLLLKAIKDAGLQQDTLVVFTSDHGEGLAAHQWVVKLCLYENPAKVPLIISWPGVVPRGFIDRTHLVSGIDLVSTLCDYARVKGPPLSRGMSLRTIIERPEATWREFLVAELASDKERPERIARMLRTARHKYIAYSWGVNSEQFFDLQNDPGETCNLARVAEFRSELERHRGLLRRWVQQTNDHFTVPG